jgi:hypothetical protein
MKRRNPVRVSGTAGGPGIRASRSAPATSRWTREAIRASQSVTTRSGSPTTKTIRLKLVVTRVRKMVNHAIPSGSATRA